MKPPRRSMPPCSIRFSIMSKFSSDMPSGPRLRPSDVSALRVVENGCPLEMVLHHIGIGRNDLSLRAHIPQFESSATSAAMPRRGCEVGDHAIGAVHHVFVHGTDLETQLMQRRRRFDRHVTRTDRFEPVGAVVIAAFASSISRALAENTSGPARLEFQRHQWLPILERSFDLIESFCGNGFSSGTRILPEGHIGIYVRGESRSSWRKQCRPPVTPLCRRQSDKSAGISNACWIALAIRAGWLAETAVHSVEGLGRMR